jgi:hypothetical protein
VNERAFVRSGGIELRRTAVKTLAIVALSAASWGTVHAAPLSLTPAAADATTNINSNLGSWGDICAAFGLSCTPEQFLLYKANVGNPNNPSTTESGPFAGSYDTVFDNTPLDPQDATISFTGAPSIVCPSCYLIVKDGRQEPAQYLFNISAWNGTDPIVLTGFWPNQGAISNVAIWGAQAVPEPSSLLLTGLGALGLAAGLRRRAKR